METQNSNSSIKLATYQYGCAYRDSPKGSWESRPTDRSQCAGPALISLISLTLLEALHFDITSRCWNWKLNSKRLAEQKKWKNWWDASQSVGCATFTLTNAWCQQSEQGEMKGNESEEVGNLWMMSTVMFLDTAIWHQLVTWLITYAYLCLLWTGEEGQKGESVCNLYKKRSVLISTASSTFKGWTFCPGTSDTYPKLSSRDNWS